LSGNDAGLAVQVSTSPRGGGHLGKLGARVRSRARVQALQSS